MSLIFKVKSRPSYKIALGVEYNGSRYFGWQRQNSVCSIQGMLEKAISCIANEQIMVFCASRTDAGVHGVGQVIHFYTNAIRKEISWTLGVNSSLPKDIAVRWMKNVPNYFHARFSATARRYHYIIYNKKLRPAILSRSVTHFHKPLDAEKMHRAAQCLVGENDFTSFRAIRCQSRTPWRNIFYINVYRVRHYIIVDIKANSFLHHMVRNIVANLIEIGSGQKPEYWIAELLEAKNKMLYSIMTNPEGLYLVSIDYPECFNLPKPSVDTIINNTHNMPFAI